MAKILISYYKLQENDIKRPVSIMEGLAKSFSECGNDVLYINTSIFNSYTSNTVKDIHINNYISSTVSDFSPDLIITFNHRIPQCILDECNAPVVIYDGDNPHYFCDQDYILSHLSRYKIFSIVDKWIDDYIKLGYNEKLIHYMPMATSIKSSIKDQCNISFLGMRFFYSSKYINIIKKHNFYNNFSSMMDEFYTTKTYDYAKLFKKYFPEIYYKEGLEEADLYPFFDIRAAVLSSLTEFGLKLCAHNGRWEFLDTTFPQLAASFDPQIVWSLQEVSDFYNSSRISLSPMHPQAKGAGFSWRVFDVLASNSCLLSSESSELTEMIHDYVDLPVFKSPSQANSIARKLLDNEDYRKKIVEGCQQFVEDHARWVHRFREMEKILDMPLVSEPGCKPGTVCHFYDDSVFMDLVANQKDTEEKSDHNGVVFYLKKAAIYAEALTVLPKKERDSFRKRKLSTLYQHPDCFFTEEQKIRLRSFLIISHKKRKAWRQKQYEKLKNSKFFNIQAAYPERVNELASRHTPIRIGFFVIFSSVFPAAPLYHKMENDPHFEPFIVVIPDISRGFDNMMEMMNKTYNDLSKSFSNVFLSYNFDTLEFEDFKDKIDIFCTASPYDYMTYKYYRIDYLHKYCLSIFFNYAFSALSFVHNVIRTPFMNIVWKVFLDTKESMKDVESIQQISGINAVVSGYIKMDEMKNV
ncbi:glycosyltransferase, partial [uncultured Mailhella sp.]|uniref:glycosyltransferase family protein n=1 Tax=uncultured Mailhella sp. TaxID=1981031 RepID=UPI0025FAF32E